ncbi:MAG: hypothetical protein COB04_03905 [Gammaproteobacteria bacterium]|nr:MAG: hypothetical protein COB04_03905 [Gammaproteobacteria bacterium]
MNKLNPLILIFTFLVFQMLGMSALGGESVDRTFCVNESSRGSVVFIADACETPDGQVENSAVEPSVKLAANTSVDPVMPFSGVEKPVGKTNHARAPENKPYSARSVQLTFGTNVARRVGDLVWSIASDNSGLRTPNVLSELSHEDLEMNELEVDFQVRFKKGFLKSFLLESRLRYGKVAHGQTQDSDYHGNDRTVEFSRSLSSNTGDYAADYSFAFGYQFFPQQWVNFNLLFGYSKHEQFIRIEDAVQNIATVSETPPLGPLDDLNTTYQATWEGAWIGAQALVNLGPLQFNWRFEHHNANYYAEANWNLRSSFAHPRSFEHITEGQGNVVDLGVSYGVPLSRGGKLFFDTVVRTQWWVTSAGLDRVFLSNGNIVTTRLNEVDWRSRSLSIGVHYVK